MNDKKKTILEYALDYNERGWCIIPIRAGTKKPAVRNWKQYQTKRPTEKQIRKWFANNNRNIAAVLGAVSGDLVCRDFDKMAEFKSWVKRFPELAKMLPTVKTAKGMHVYFEGQLEGIKHIQNGELRGKGGYCLLPPSIHPDGNIYQWVNPLLDGNLLKLDPKLSGFMTSDVTEHTEHTEKTEQTEQLEAMVVDGNIKKAINETLPIEFGTRNRMIFEFARTLKSLPQYNDAEPEQFRDIVRAWHKRALPNIKTKEFKETWIDFLKAWPRIKYKKGEEPIMKIFEKAIQLEPPRIAVEKYPEHNKLKVLVSLCKELQKAAGQNPFFLSVRTAGELLKVSPMQASRRLFLLESDGIVKLVCKGGTAETVRKASRYRYIAN